MRRFLLIAAMFLISVSAQAETSRGLTIASSNEAAAPEQPKAVEAPKAEAPKAEMSKAATSKVDTRSDQAKPVSDKAEKRKLKRKSIETRVISELHRHGIYW